MKGRVPFDYMKVLEKRTEPKKAYTTYDKVTLYVVYAFFGSVRFSKTFI